MVIEGNFQVELVYADTKKTFLEHKHKENGQTYVEVEPDCDYFVSVAACKPLKNGLAIFNVTVDGEELDYDSYLSDGDPGPKLEGIWSRDEKGGEITTAFKFAKSAVMLQTKENNGKAPEMWTGKVEVFFYEAIPEVIAVPPSHSGAREGKAYQSTWKGNAKDVGFMHGKTDPDKKKCVMSVVGKTSEYTAPKPSSGYDDHNSAGYKVEYDRGDLLQTVCLNYCSTVGLIHANILLPPPDFWWQDHRRNFPGPQNFHADKMESPGVFNLMNDQDSPGKVPKLIAPIPNKRDKAATGQNTATSLELMRAKKRQKLEILKKEVEGNLPILRAQKDDSQEDKDEYEKAKGLHKQYREEIAALIQEEG